MSNVKKIALSLAAAALVLGLAACGGNGGSNETTTTARTPESAQEGGKGAKEKVPTIVVRNDEPVDGIERLEYNAGETIRFKVESDKAEEVHLHGYDVMKDIPAGGSVTFDLPAEIEGIFEAELEGVGVQIAEIRVNP